MRKFEKVLLSFGLLVCTACSGKSSEAVSVSSASEEETAEETPTPVLEPVVSEATMFLCGDALLHMTVNYDSEVGDGTYNYQHILERLAAISNSYDLSYYNQETLLAGEAFGYSGYPQFNSPQDWGDYMIDYCGFDLVSTANNHCLDRGTDGIIASLDYWETKDAITAGTNRTQEEYDTIRYGSVNGISYAFLSWCENMNGFQCPEGMEYMVNCFGNDDGEAMLAQVREAKKNADVVILAIHWGVEYSTYPEEWQQELARELADAGADIIIGNHPHMIQPVEWIGDTICFYALGNIIAAQYDDSRIGILASLKITKTESELMKNVEISDVKCDLHYTYYRDYWIDNFDIIPFSQMDDDHLYGYQDTYNRMIQIVTAMDDSIEIGGF